MRALALRVGIVAVGATMLTLAVSAHGDETPVPCAGVRLNAATWHTEHERSLMSRSPTGAEQLASNLVRCRALVGMRRTRVRQLLGRPDEGGGAAWLYQLALNRGILSQPEYLRLAFSPQHVVTRAEILPPGQG
jgi:hypothetical protein